MSITYCTVAVNSIREERYLERWGFFYIINQSDNLCELLCAISWPYFLLHEVFQTLCKHRARSTATPRDPEFRRQKEKHSENVVSVSFYIFSTRKMEAC